MFEDYDPSKPPYKLSYVFQQAFSSAMWETYEGRGFFDTFLKYSFLWGTFALAPVFGLLGWLKGMNFFVGWFVCILAASTLHVLHWLLQAGLDTVATRWRQRAYHHGFLKKKADWIAAAPQRAEIARRAHSAKIVDSLFLEVNTRQQAPARAAQALALVERERAQRRAELEKKLAARFVNFRFRKDWCGTADIERLHAAFRQSIRDKPPFSAEEMALLSTTNDPNTQLLLSPPSK